MKQSEKMQALYDKAPYPESLEGQMSQTTPLLTHWINAASIGGQALFAKARMLVAGCGSGAEALMLAELYPEADVLGIDFSAKSIERAKLKAEDASLKNIHFAVADLMEGDWIKEQKPFDFILCHGVADYVADPELLMPHFADLLEEEGILCMTVNSPYHPAGRIRKAFTQLGVKVEDYEDSIQQRMQLQIMDQLMGAQAGIQGVGRAPTAYLEVDIFPPIAHHDSIETWTSRAKGAGLLLAGAMDAPLGLLDIPDTHLSLLYSMSKADLSIWMAELRQGAGIQMLFSKALREAPDFTNFTKLLSWTPKLANCVGELPLLEGDPKATKTLTLRFQGLPDFVINSNAYDLEVLRLCDGNRSLGEIRKMMEAEGDLASLMNALFRAYHYGLLSSGFE